MDRDDANDLPRHLWRKVVPITFQIILDTHNSMGLYWKGYTSYGYTHTISHDFPYISLTSPFALQATCAGA